MSRSTKLVRRIIEFNHGRDHERLQRKYKAMAKDALGFFRGSCHLFCEDWPRQGPLNKLPRVWACGDLHLENFGAYTGDDRLVYFDLADFDESALAPCAFDLARLLTSAMLAARMRKMGRAATERLCRIFLDGYTAALRDGKARWIERSVARGPIRAVLHRALLQTRAALLAKRTEWRGGARKLVIDGEHTLPLGPGEHARLERVLRELPAQQGLERFFHLHDAARRIAGTGALGLERYTLLVEGWGGRSGHALLDLKRATPSALVAHLEVRQPKWASDAHRVVAVQRRMQAISPAFLQPVMMGRRSYVLRELMPTQDKLDLKQWHGTDAALEVLARDLGFLLAWSELRSGGRTGSATIDELIAFAGRKKWNREVIAYAEHYSEIAWDDWAAFRDAYREHGARLR